MNSPELTPEPNICNDYSYPSYRAVCELLSRVKQINVSTEYSKVNHEYLKIIWDNIDDENIIRTVGENITHTGGYVALQASYYTLLHVMRPLVKNNHEKYIQSWYDIKTSVSKAWDGVGEWRH
jgi:hypothetical protein